MTVRRTHHHDSESTLARITGSSVRSHAGDTRNSHNQHIRKVCRRDRPAPSACVFVDLEAIVDDHDESEREGSGLETDDSIEGAFNSTK